MARKVKHKGKKPEHVKRQADIDRKKHFADKKSLTEWNGGPNTVIPDKKKERNKKACRKNIEDNF